MHIEVWQVGKTKEAWVREAASIYMKKCSRYGKLSEVLIKEEKSKDPSQVKSAESGRILDKLDKAQHAYTILLDERGTMYSSVQLARHLHTTTMHKGGRIRFITGGPFGVTDEVRSECDELLSLSSMVFTHEMVRVILLEQLYRAFTILRGESYHHT